MKHFIDIEDIQNVPDLLQEAIYLKKKSLSFKSLGQHKTLGLLFFNASLRTRLSTQKAAQNLGMQCMTLNFTTDSWQIEFGDGSIMNGSSAEHIKEAAAVISQYCNIIAVRAFPSLTNKEKDEKEQVLQSFKKYASVPVINMESATAHPLQAVADAITIAEQTKKATPKVVLSWAPHPKALPHAVANSFVKIMQQLPVNLVITHPKGYELNKAITKTTPIQYSQEEALKNADFVYVKNWSSYNSYGKVLSKDSKWMLTQEKMKLTNSGKFMHCLPVRRNVIVEDAVIDSNTSLVIEQANNRTYAAQIILKKILEHENTKSS
jgi:N-succinyl-L-ornithine transcarbamylase